MCVGKEWKEKKEVKWNYQEVLFLNIITTYSVPRKSNLVSFHNVFKSFKVLICESRESLSSRLFLFIFFSHLWFICLGISFFIPLLLSFFNLYFFVHSSRFFLPSYIFFFQMLCTTNIRYCYPSKYEYITNARTEIDKLSLYIYISREIIVLNVFRHILYWFIMINVYFIASFTKERSSELSRCLPVNGIGNVTWQLLSEDASVKNARRAGSTTQPPLTASPSSQLTVTTTTTSLLQTCLNRFTSDRTWKNHPEVNFQCFKTDSLRFWCSSWQWSS